MFTKIKEAIQILSYSEPTDGPDAVIVEDSTAPSRVSRRIAGTIEFVVVIYGVGYVAGILAKSIQHAPPAQNVSIATLTGALGALLLWVGHDILAQIQQKVKLHIRLADRLAPYFGHKLDYVSRVFKGSVRA